MDGLIEPLITPALVSMPADIRLAIHELLNDQETFSMSMNEEFLTNYASESTLVAMSLTGQDIFTETSHPVYEHLMSLYSGQWYTWSSDGENEGIYPQLSHLRFVRFNFAIALRVHGVIIDQDIRAARAVMEILQHSTELRQFSFFPHVDGGDDFKTKCTAIRRTTTRDGARKTALERELDYACAVIELMKQEFDASVA